MIRGKIIYRDRAKQIRDFSGLVFENVTPTDVDGFIEFNNCIYIFIETKYQNELLPAGQERALKNLVDTVFESSKKGLLIIAKHQNPVNEDIPFHACEVTKYRSRKNWYVPDKKRTIKSLIDMYIKKNCIDCPNVNCSANKYIKARLRGELSDKDGKENP